MIRKQFEADDAHFSAAAYTAQGYRGIAWHVLGWETEPGKCEWFDDEIQEWVYDEEPEPVRTGRVIAVMIGDNRRFSFDEDELQPIEREEYCGVCGQVGCAHDGLERE